MKILFMRLGIVSLESITENRCRHPERSEGPELTTIKYALSLSPADKPALLHKIYFVIC